MFRGIAIALSLSAGLLFSSTASAAVVFSASSGTKSAQATFDIVGTNLTVLLSNTSLYDATQPTDILTGVFWKSNTSLANLTRVSATMTANSVTEYVAMPSNGVVSGEWAWKGNLTGGPGGDTNGISAAGLGLFSPTDRFPGSSLSGPTAVAGLDWGLAPAGDNTATGNGGVLGTALVKNGVLFTFSGLPTAFKLSDINSVIFQYGTSCTEPELTGSIGNISPVPAPASLGGGLLLLGSLAFNRLRRRAA
jgi:hypothetical protein